MDRRTDGHGETIRVPCWPRKTNKSVHKSNIFWNQIRGFGNHPTYKLTIVYPSLIWWYATIEPKTKHTDSIISYLLLFCSYPIHNCDYIIQITGVHSFITNRFVQITGTLITFSHCKYLTLEKKYVSVE
jgi:hypothetical protein